MRHRTPAMHETQLLIHLREQVSRKARHILGNLVEAEHNPSKMTSSLLRVYEKKLGTYYQEYAKLHQEILDRIPASEFEEQGDLEMDFYRLHTEALLRIEQLSVILAGEYQLSDSEVRVLESFQSRQRSEPVREKLSGQSNVKPLNHVATTGSNVESAQVERSNRPSVTPINHTVIPTQPPAKSQPKECRAFGGLHNRHQEKSVAEDLYHSSSLEPQAISETLNDQPSTVKREHDRSSCTKKPRHTTRCGVPSTEDRQGAEWKRTSLQAELTPTKLSCRSTVRSDHQPKNAQKEHCKPVSIRNHRQLESARVEHSDSPSYTVKSDESGAPGRLRSVDHQHRFEPAQKKYSYQPRVESYPVHSTTSVEHQESTWKEYSKPTSTEQQIRRVEASTETVTVKALKTSEPAQEKLSGPSSVEQPVHTATFVIGSDFPQRMQTRSSVMELTNPHTTEPMASKKESEPAQEELSDLSCVQQTVHTTSFTVEPEYAYKEYSKPCSDDLPDFTAENPRYMKIDQDERFKLSHVMPLCGATAATQWEIVLDKPRQLLDEKPSLATVIHQVESALGEPSKPSTCEIPLVIPAMFSKGSEMKTMECGSVTADSVKVAPNTAVRVTVFGSNSEKGKFHDLQRLKVTKKWHTKPSKPPPRTSANVSRTALVGEHISAEACSEMTVEQLSPSKEGHAGLSKLMEISCVKVPTKCHPQPPRRGRSLGKIPMSRLLLQMHCREDNRHAMPLLRQECFQPGGSMFAPIGRSGEESAPLSPTRLNGVTRAPANVNTATARDHSPPTMMTMLIDDDSCERARVNAVRMLRVSDRE